MSSLFKAIGAGAKNAPPVKALDAYLNSLKIPCTDSCASEVMQIRALAGVVADQWIKYAVEGLGQPELGPPLKRQSCKVAGICTIADGYSAALSWRLTGGLSDDLMALAGMTLEELGLPAMGVEPSFEQQLMPEEFDQQFVGRYYARLDHLLRLARAGYKLAHEPEQGSGNGNSDGAKKSGGMGIGILAVAAFAAYAFGQRGSK